MNCMVRTSNVSSHWCRLVTWLGAALAIGLALACGPALADDDDPPGRVGRVTESQGQSWLYDGDAGEWIALQRNRPLTSGNRIAVDGNARLELRVGSTTVRLAGGSELEIRRIDDERIDLFLLGGSAALRVRSQDVAREVELATAEGRFTPRRAGHYRIDRRDGTSFATTWNGELRFEGEDSALDIASGRSAELWREANATHYSWAEPQTDEFADWVTRANREDERTVSTRYVSPEMTGWEDLDRNGRWDTHPEYGPLWVPTAVAAGWAPYRYGHWAWISPWGWTWVDDAPWGFAPFHYGRWVVVGGHWCWAPGRYVARPVYAPALVAWIGGSYGGVHVGVGAPVVGWVPLAPREPYYPYYSHRSNYWKNVNHAHLHLFPQNTPRTIPTRAIMYANQRASGGISAVPSSALVSRRPVAPAIAQVDPALRNNLSNQPLRPHAPPPGVARAIVAPGGNAAAPGAGVVRPGLQPSPRQPSPAQRAQPPTAGATPGNEPRRERIPRPVPPRQALPGTGPMQPQVRSNVLPPQLTAPAPHTPPAQAAPRRTDPGEGGGMMRREPPGRPGSPLAAPQPRAVAPAPPVRSVPAPPPARPEVRTPRAPPPAAVHRAPPPAQAPAQREIQREIQRDQREMQRDQREMQREAPRPSRSEPRVQAPEPRGRGAEARVRAPEARARVPEARVRVPESRAHPGRVHMQ